MRRYVLCLLILFLRVTVHAQSSAWCGYALIEGVPGIDRAAPILSLLTPDAGRADVLPDQLFQVKYSLDGTKAIVEACWKIFPSRDVIVNLLTLTGSEAKEAVDQKITYSLFAPYGSREDSAASVREYLAKNITEWEVIEDESGGRK